MTDQHLLEVASRSGPRIEGGGDGVSLLELLSALAAQRWLFLGVAFIGSILSLAYALNVQRYYSAVTVVMPPQQQQNATSTALAQLGMLSGMGGLGGGSKTLDELYIALLKSRSLQDALIRRHALQNRYQTKTMTDTRMILGVRVAVTIDKKSGLITVSVDDTEAEFAALLANSHVDELRKVLASLAVTEAQQRRVFFEQQVAKTQAALIAAETKFRELQARSGMVVTQSLAEAGVKAAIELRSQIAEREIQLSAMSRFATPQNQAVLKLAAELAALRQQLQRLESGSSGQTVMSGGLDSVKAYRDMKVQEAALDALIKQFELAKLDESRDAPLLQQVDAAVPPEYATKPKRSSIVIAGTLLSGVLGAIIAISRAFAKRRRQSRDAASGVQRMTDALN